MKSRKSVWLAVSSCILMMFVAGPGCPDLDDIFSDELGLDFLSSDDQDETNDQDATDDQDTTDDDSTTDEEEDGEEDEGETISVTFSLSAKVVTSLGTGLNGATVTFQADKFYWDDYEEEWVLRRSYSDSRVTSTIGLEAGMTTAWQFTYNLHEGETIFFTATEQETSTQQETTLTFAQAKASAGM